MARAWSHCARPPGPLVQVKIPRLRVSRKTTVTHHQGNHRLGDRTHIDMIEGLHRKRQMEGFETGQCSGRWPTLLTGDARILFSILTQLHQRIHEGINTALSNPRSPDRDGLVSSGSSDGSVLLAEDLPSPARWAGIKMDSTTASIASRQGENCSGQVRHGHKSFFRCSTETLMKDITPDPSLHQEEASRLLSDPILILTKK